MATCIFCQIISKEVSAPIVWEDGKTLAFLDHRPLFPGHCLLVPKAHHETLADLPASLLGPFFKNAQRLSVAVQSLPGAEGTFMAMNNVVSQSVPHLHCHIVPRHKGDGLKGFFWPRTKYQDDGEMEKMRKLLETKIEKE
jgi:histidine triad (HIT) family protein